MSDSPASYAGPSARIVYGPAMTLAAHVVRYTAETLGEVPAQWARFASRVPYLPGRRGPATYGLCYPWSEGTLDYGCAVEVIAGTVLPTGWKAFDVPTMRWAVFAHDGHFSELNAIEARLLRDWLPAAAQRRALDVAGGVEAIERYGPRFDPRAGRGDIEIWLPLEG